MNSHNGAKVDYQDFDERTVDFIKKLKRVFADINIRIAAVEAIKTMADDFERRYGQVALDRIDAGIAPVLAAATGALDQARADLAAIDAAYRENGIERVDAIINPLVAAAQAALVAADQKVAELEAFLAAKQSVAEKGQANGYAGLDAAGKVPAAQLPALTTTATVGAALAGASQEATPADGDRLAGIKAGGSTPFWITFGNLKARLKSYFDGIYALSSSLGNAATRDVGVAAGTVAAGDDSRIVNALQPGDIPPPEPSAAPATKVEYLTSASWDKPEGINPDALVLVEIWAGGGGGGIYGGGSAGAGGGGGGAYNHRIFRAAELASAVPITIGAGGAVGRPGGSTSFGSYLTCFGGGGGKWQSGSATGGGGGGGGDLGVGGGDGDGGSSGAPGGSGFSEVGAGASGGSGGTGGHAMMYGGGGGGGGQNNGNTTRGGNSMYGGGGGAGGFGAADYGGVSLYGGKGGNPNGTIPPQVPGGGGGSGQPGAAGKCTVWIIG